MPKKEQSLAQQEIRNVYASVIVIKIQIQRTLHR